MSIYEKFYSKNNYNKNFLNTDRLEKPYNIDYFHYSLTKRNNFTNNFFYSYNNLENMNQYNNSIGEMLKPSENIFELELEFRQLKNSINELNEKLKEKDKIISTLKRKIRSISSRNSENKKKNISINIKENNFLRTIETDKPHNQLLNNNYKFFKNKYSFSFQNNTNKFPKDDTFNSIKNSFGNSNINLSTTIKNTEYNSTIKTKISQENSLIKHKPLTLTYFRYQKELEKKKNKNSPSLIRTNLFYKLYNENLEQDFKRKKRNKHLSLINNKNENGIQLSIEDTQRTKYKSNDNKNEIDKKKIVNGEKNLFKKKNTHLKSPIKLRPCCLTAKIKNVKEKNNSKEKTNKHNDKTEKSQLRKKQLNKNKNKIEISKKRFYKMGMTYKELHKIKIFHNKVYSESKNENKKNIKILIGNYTDVKTNKYRLNFDSENKKREKKPNLKYNNQNQKNEFDKIKNEFSIKNKPKKPKLKFVDMDDNNEQEKLYENIEEKNLLEIKNILQNEINSFSRKTEDRKDNKKDDSLSIQIELDSKSDVNNSNFDMNFQNKANENLLLNLKENDEKDSDSSENLLNYSSKLKDIYKNNEAKASIIKSSSSKEISFEKTLSDIQITVNNLDIPFNEK